MRINHMIFVGSLAALVATMAPALAKNSQTQKTEEQASSSSCHAYQQASDGTWMALPCQAHGATTSAAAQTERRQQMTGRDDVQR